MEATKKQITVFIVTATLLAVTFTAMVNQYGFNNF